MGPLNTTLAQIAMGQADASRLSPVNTPLTDRVEAIINEMIDTASATLTTQEGTFSRLFGSRQDAGAEAVPPDPQGFADRINIKLQRLHAMLREAKQNAIELNNRI